MTKNEVRAIVREELNKQQQEREQALTTATKAFASTALREVRLVSLMQRESELKRQSGLI
jgi:hypothetical protein